MQRVNVQPQHERQAFRELWICTLNTTDDTKAVDKVDGRSGPLQRRTFST